MADFILVDGDKANYMRQFGAALVSVQFGILKGSGPGKINNKTICVEGDESSAFVENCSYITPQYYMPGFGKIEITSLDESQVASDTKTGNTKVMLKGNYFKAKFTVTSPAKMQNAANALEKDPTPDYPSGRGFFLTTNVKIKSS